VGDLRDGGNVQHEPMEVVDCFLRVPMEPARAEFLLELRSLGGVIRIIIEFLSECVPGPCRAGPMARITPN
jgi:hypothetical protein